MTSPLPEFKKPPVSEVAISVEFTPLENWRSPHGGMYWARIIKSYPNTEVQPPLPSQIEKFGEEFFRRPMFQVEISAPDSSRFWFIADPANNLIQVQRDRFIINWRKLTSDAPYPRYLNELRPRLQREWNDFKKFVAENKIGMIDVRQCDITYVNDIPQGEGWDTFGDSLSLFSPWWSKGSDGYLPLPETLSLSGSFPLGGEAGRFHFAAQHTLRQTDGRQIVQLRLVSRGKPRSSEDADLLAWLDMGHEWIVRGFADLTSRKAHEMWGRTK